MSNQHMLYEDNVNEQNHSKLIQFFIDVKFLLKGKVLVANVLPVLTGFFLALYFSNQNFSNHWQLFLLTMIGSTLVISGALILNNWYEVDLDRKMERTEKRPTVSGNFTLNSVLWAGIITTIVGHGLMLLVTWEAALYSFLGWFVYVVLYTFWTKRKYTWNTIIGSVSGAFTPLIGWAALLPANHIVPITMFIILFIWQIPHSLAVYINRLEDYTRAGIPMFPVVRGVDEAIKHNLLWVAHLLPFPFLLLGSLGWGFVIFATILGVTWVIFSAKGFKAEDKQKWAKGNLRFSLIYLILLSLYMILIGV
ncbi:heme o synthase [Pallidibacillus pasinlerensis]|nr:heme o synthase [Pallidibacillus pasinlerensis]